MEELYNLCEQDLDNSDPHGYYNVNDHEQFADPVKRFFLSQCILQIYIMSGKHIPIIPMHHEYNETVMRHNLNMLMETSSLTTREILLQRVKRRLFRECKKKRRKCQKPQLNSSKLSESVYFKTLRYILGIRKVRRSYLDNAKENIRYGLNQKCKFTEDAVDDAPLTKNQVHLNTNNGGLFQQGYSLEEDCCLSRRAKKLEQMLNEYCYRELSIANDAHLEGTVRGISYLKTLMRIMSEEDEGNLYTENK